VTDLLQPLPPIVARVLGHEQRASAMLAYVVSERGAVMLKLISAVIAAAAFAGVC
jgi:hypothetical protein